MIAASGLVTFAATQDDDEPDPTPATSSTQPARPDDAALAAAVTAALEQELGVPLTLEQASCISQGLLGELEPDELARLADDRAAVEAIGAPVRDRLVAVVVGCVPEEVAASLLGGGSTTSSPAEPEG